MRIVHPWSQRARCPRGREGPPLGAAGRVFLQGSPIQCQPCSTAVRKRFAETAAAIAELQDRAGRRGARPGRSGFCRSTGTERVLDVGTGAGALALAVAPLAKEVVGIDLVPELLARAASARRRTPSSSRATPSELPFGPGTFDVVMTARTLHHVARPELVLAEMTRVLRPGGLMLVVDQLAPNDPLAAIELNRFEQARDPSTSRILADVDLRGLFDTNGLVLRRSEVVSEERDLESYLDLAGCAGEERERARSLAPTPWTAHYGWYVLAKPGVCSRHEAARASAASSRPAGCGRRRREPLLGDRRVDRAEVDVLLQVAVAVEAARRGPGTRRPSCGARSLAHQERRRRRRRGRFRSSRSAAARRPNSLQSSVTTRGRGCAARGRAGTPRAPPRPPSPRPRAARLVGVRVVRARRLERDRADREAGVEQRREARRAGARSRRPDTSTFVW